MFKSLTFALTLRYLLREITGNIIHTAIIMQFQIFHDPKYKGQNPNQSGDNVLLNKILRFWGQIKLAKSEYC
jgi:hypothetical protein